MCLDLIGEACEIEMNWLSKFYYRHRSVSKNVIETWVLQTTQSSPRGLLRINGINQRSSLIRFAWLRIIVSPVRDVNYCPYLLVSYILRFFPNSDTRKFGRSFIFWIEHPKSVQDWHLHWKQAIFMRWKHTERCVSFIITAIVVIVNIISTPRMRYFYHEKTCNSTECLWSAHIR